jgi:hypothetical protein
VFSPVSGRFFIFGVDFMAVMFSLDHVRAWIPRTDSVTTAQMLIPIPFRKNIIFYLYGFTGIGGNVLGQFYENLEYALKKQRVMVGQHPDMVTQYGN